MKTRNTKLVFSVSELHNSMAKCFGCDEGGFVWLEVGGNQSLAGLCEMGFVVYRGVKSVAGFRDGKEEQ
ncbi:hypothetical protein SO802_026294 [Lithocarpus litseifolius]|uniref:Uncharacterized protein n=1 Tax=Lithocarpus litseifolius TaxID=425828 RepID=A0AAW2C2U4_9ROSI